MATTATLNPTNLLFVNSGNQESKITSGSGFFRFDGASASDAVTLRNVGDATSADHALNKSQHDAAVTAASAARTAMAASLTTAYQAADSTLQSNIDSEAAARSSGDTTLQSNLDAVEAAATAARAALSTSITSAFQAADTTLQSNIDAEAASRVAADQSATAARASMASDISSNTSAIAAETTARVSAVAAAVSTAAADATAKVASEATLRANGDAQTLVDSKAYTDAEVATASAAANSYTDGRVDALASGVSWKDSCVVITKQALPACAYDAAAGTLTGSAAALLTIDSVTPAVGERVLVNSQASKKHNGIYQVTANAANATFVLTRTSDANTSDSLSSAAVFVTQGSQSESAFILVGDGVVLNTSDISFTIMSSPGTYSGAGAVSIDSAKVISIAPLGIQNSMLAADCVDSSKLADDCTGTEHLQDDCVTSAQMADNSVLDAACAFTDVSCATVTASGVVQAVSYTATSDERLKTMVEDLDPAESCEMVKKFRTCKYRFTERPHEDRMGTIAQSLMENGLDTFVRVDEDKPDKMMSVNYIDYIAVLSCGLKSALERIEQLEAQ